MTAFVRIVSTLSRASGTISVLLLIAAILVVSEMVFVRYVLRASTIWQTEFVIYALVAATFLGSPYVLLHRGHVAVELLPDAVSPTSRRWLAILSGVLSLVFCALLAWSGWHYFAEAWEGGWTTDTVWALPLWIALMPLPAGISLLALQYIAEIWKNLGETTA
ncbi:MAG: TRAP transporter small permease [Hyphomicrobiales bacterium]|nr:TRAP transporter small permease [Hyphomicrobiales bacterium]